MAVVYGGERIGTEAKVESGRLAGGSCSSSGDGRRNRRRGGTPWWSSGEDSTLSMLRVRAGGRKIPQAACHGQKNKTKRTTGAGGSGQKGERFWIQRTLGGYSPRETERVRLRTEAQSGAGVVVGRPEELHVGHPRRDGECGSSAITLPWEPWEASPKSRLEWKGPSPLAQGQASLSLASRGQAGTSWPRDTLWGQACRHPPQPKGREASSGDTRFGQGAVEVMSSGSSATTPTSLGLWPQLWPWEWILRRRPEGRSLGLGSTGLRCSSHSAAVLAAVV